MSAVAALVVLAFALAGCHESGDPPVYTYTATDYAFAGPATLPPGFVTLRIQNDGDEHHHIQLLKLGEGKTLADVQAHFQTATGMAMPDWLTMVGGPNAPDPGESTLAVLDLEPGNHVMLCFIPDHDGTPHFAHGMMKAVTVSGDATSALEPEDTVDVGLADYAFEAPDMFHAGAQTMKIHNAGAEPHELALAKFAEGKGLPDLLAFFGPNSTGPPPATFHGGSTGIEPGMTAWFPTDLEAGSYVFLCFFETSEHELHAMKGMVHEFTIE